MESGWLAVLTELEAAADHAEQLLSDGAAPAPLTEPWRAPRGLGPLPAALAGRAGALVRRQRALLRSTGDEVADRRRALRAVDSMRTAPAGAPVYLDIQA